MKKIHASGVIVEDKSGEILVLKRHVDSLEGQTWGLVGGKIDEEEDKLRAALREAAEEINHSIPRDELTFIKTYTWEYKGTSFIFEVYKYQTKKDTIEIELDETKTPNINGRCLPTC